MIDTKKETAVLSRNNDIFEEKYGENFQYLKYIMVNLFLPEVHQEESLSHFTIHLSWYTFNLMGK